MLSQEEAVEKESLARLVNNKPKELLSFIEDSFSKLVAVLASILDLIIT